MLLLDHTKDSFNSEKMCVHLLWKLVEIPKDPLETTSIFLVPKKCYTMCLNQINTYDTFSCNIHISQVLL